MSNRLTFLLLLMLLVIGGFFRFYNLNWDSGLGFHPDERNNIVLPAYNLKPPYKPDNFTYGSFTIYVYHFTSQALFNTTLDQSWLTAEKIAVIGRFYSALFSMLIIILIFYLGKVLYSDIIGILAATFTTFNVGLIQAAHFATTETILAVTGILTTLAGYLITKRKNYSSGYLLFGLILGIATGAKITALVFLPSFLLAHIIFLSKKQIWYRNLFMLISLSLATLSFFIISPYSILSFDDFRTSFQFENDIANGKTPMFFTTQFQETSPYIFQIGKILFWILGLPTLLLGFLGFLIVFCQNIKKFNNPKLLLWFIPLFYFLYFGSIFAKWTRYMLPIIPFFCIFSAITLINIYRLSKTKFTKYITILLIVFILVWQSFYALAFLKIYRQKDTRIEASEWIYQTIPFGSSLLLEPLDVVALPISIQDKSSSDYMHSWFEFYDLDQNEPIKQTALVKKLAEQLARIDYIIIGSRRIYANRLRLSHKFPTTALYYNRLFDGSLGFEKIKQFTSYPQIFNIQFHDDSAEETFQVFDHPKVIIFKNIDRLPDTEIKRLLLE